MTAIDMTAVADVLVIGGSGAAVSAACSAAAKGADVLLVSKGRAGFSGNAIMAGGGCGIDGESGKTVLGIQEADAGFGREQLFSCMVKESFFLAEQPIVQQYIDEAPLALREYLGWAEKAGSKLVFQKPCGWQGSGTQFARPLGQALREREEIRVLEDVMVTDLVGDGRQVWGAIGIEIPTGRILQVLAKAVIIATGGYQPFSLKNTVSDMTGDGLAMACRAGAALSDMEFLLAFPTALVPETMRGSIYPYLIRKIPHRIIDRFGREVCIEPEIQSLSQRSKLTKLIHCYYMGQAAASGGAGPHGGVFWDFSVSPPQERRAALDQFYQGFSRWHKYGFYKGESMAQVDEMVMKGVPLEVGLGVEYSMGGIVINEKMETEVEGLFAAGEAATGTFGACRVGDGLIEMLSQGRRAGIEAAAYAGKMVGRLDFHAGEETAQELLRYFEPREGTSPEEIRLRLEKACDVGLNVIRTQEKIAGTLSEIRELRCQPMRLRCRSRAYNLEWMQAIQTKNLLLCCEAAAVAALERRESRGCHIRADYPAVDHEQYLHHYDFRCKGDSLSVSIRKPAVTKLSLPRGRAENILAYFTDPKLAYSRDY